MRMAFKFQSAVFEALRERLALHTPWPLSCGEGAEGDIYLGPLDVPEPQGYKPDF